MFWRPACLIFLLLNAATLPGCYAGLAGAIALVAAASDSGGGGAGNAPASVSDIRIADTELSPAVIDFTLIDPEGDPADVRILFRRPNGTQAETVTTLVASDVISNFDGRPIDPNLKQLPASRAGVRHRKLWDFLTQGISESFIDGYQIQVAIDSDELELNPQPENAVALGMAPPRISLKPVVSSGEDVDGIVPITFDLADESAGNDPSSEPVDVLVEFRLTQPADGAVPTWMRATRAGFEQGGEGPGECEAEIDTLERACFSFRDEPVGNNKTFFWDTDQDLEDLDVFVQLRFTARESRSEMVARDALGNIVSERFVVGEPIETEEFNVDNNDEPIAFLKSASFLANDDKRRGVPIPFRVVDNEGDDVQVLFQWSFAGEEFPEPELRTLPIEEIEGILSDPLQRRTFQIATELPLQERGFLKLDAGAGDGLSVRLPALARSGNRLSAAKVGGQELLIERPSPIPTPLGLPVGVISEPVATLPVRNGITALLLDDAGQWRLREIDLASGEIVRTVASGSGAAQALTFEPTRRSVLTVVEVSGLVRLLRVPLPPHEAQEKGCPRPPESADSEPSSPSLLIEFLRTGPVRDLVSLSDNSSLLTMGESLVRVEYGASTESRVLLDSLESPWGMALDPVDGNQLFLAERGNGVTSGRLLKVYLDSLQVIPLATQSPLVRPEELTIEPRTRTLWFISDPFGDGMKRLHRLQLGGVFAGEPIEIPSPLPPGEVSDLETGEAGLVVITLRDQNDLAVGGGVQQRRCIVDYSPTTQIAQVDRPFLPSLQDLQPWRIQTRLGLVSATPDPGTEASFLWDTRDIPGGGQVVVRTVPIDSEVGTGQVLDNPRDLLAPLDVEPMILGSGETTAAPFAVITADLDSDGDLDIVSANRDSQNLTIFLQHSPGIFGEPDAENGLIKPDRVLVVEQRDASVLDVRAADLNDDGRLDLVTANSSEAAAQNPDINTLTIFFHPQEGFFRQNQTQSVTLGGGDSVISPSVVAVSDFDRDGLLDVVSSNQIGDNLTLFLQPSVGFRDQPSPDLVFRNAPSDLERTTLADPDTVAVADIDGDGRMDLAAANDDSNTVSIFFQDDWFEAIEARREITSADVILSDMEADTGLRFLLAVDLDNDADLDILTANFDTDKITAFFQIGPRTFGPAVTLASRPTLRQPRWLDVGDFNGDGRTDVVSANFESNDLTVFFQPQAGFANGPPAEALRLGIPEASPTPVSVAASDLDGNGTLDLVATNFGANSLSVFLQKKPGAFGVPSPLGDSQHADATLAGGLASPAAQVAAADIDSDGVLDLVFAVENQNLLSVFSQRSTGAFNSEPDLTLDAGRLPKSVLVTDLNGDGLMDISSTSESKRQPVALFFQRDSAGDRLEERFVATADLVLGSETTTKLPHFVVAEDLNGDALLDLIIANKGTAGDPLDFADGNLTIFYQPPTGFQDDISEPNVRLGGNLQTEGARFVTVADLNSDGRGDLVSANEDGKNITVFIHPEGGFQSRETPDLIIGDVFNTNRPHSVAVADFNEDGIPDLVSANKSSEGTPEGANLTIYLQPNGGFAFSGESVVSPDVILGGSGQTEGATSVITADLNDDGLLDIACANDQGNSVTIFIRPGHEFTAGQPPTVVLTDDVALNPVFLIVEDLDSDTDLDVITCGQNTALYFGCR